MATLTYITDLGSQQKARQLSTEELDHLRNQAYNGQHAQGILGQLGLQGLQSGQAWQQQSQQYQSSLASQLGEMAARSAAVQMGRMGEGPLRAAVARALPAKDESGLQWLDRRVNEIRVQLA